MKTKTILFGLALGLLAACGVQQSPQVDVAADLRYCDAQVRRTLRQLERPDGTRDYTLMPRNIADTASVWHCRKATREEWYAGFWPGVLWYDYEFTRDTAILREAERYTESLGFLSRVPAYDHDLGFLVYCSYGNGFRLTGNPAYRQVLLDVADTLATLYRPRVGALLSWPRNVKMFGGHNVIMDNMMNLELLFWAARNGGDKRLYDIAVSHAEKTMQYHFRPDYTSYHVAVYDTLDGRFVKGVTHQGYADSTMWARGQAWAIYGFTTVYRETKDVRYLNFVQKVADVYLRRLPADDVPFWDFDDPAGAQAPRDASAACVVASALIELSGYVDEATSARYLDAARRMLASLAAAPYRCGASKPAFLAHSVGNLPAGSEIDASIIYADYYYIEALTRLRALDKE